MTDAPGSSPSLELHAETLAIGKRIVERTVQVRRETRTRDVAVNETLNNTSVVIERVAVGRIVDAVPPVREEDGVTILPVVEEILVVERRLRLKEEVHIRRIAVPAPYTETVALRQQHAVVTWSDPRSPGSREAAGPDAAQDMQPAERKSLMPNETIVAVFDTAAHAEQAVSDLLAANVPEADIHRHTGEGSYAGATTTPMARPREEPGFWASLFGGHAGHDETVYDSSLQSGGNVVTVSDVPDRDVEAVISILERHNPVDIDERGAALGGTHTMADGMAGTAAAGGSAALDASVAGMDPVRQETPYTDTRPGQTEPRAGMADYDAARLDTATTASPATAALPLASTATPAAPMARTGTAEEGGVIQLAEESLSIGKRLINQGGTRIRRYVVETPVQEDVTLRTESVTLDRRPVTDGRPVGDNSFTEKTIEMTESSEEPVVSKTARVVEEVGLRKEASERVETVRDTVRKEQVDVEQLAGGRTAGETPAGRDPSTPRT